jgi:hypothetical protein
MKHFGGFFYQTGTFPGFSYYKYRLISPRILGRGSKAVMGVEGRTAPRFFMLMAKKQMLRRPKPTSSF